MYRPRGLQKVMKHDHFQLGLCMFSSLHQKSVWLPSRPASFCAPQTLYLDFSEEGIKGKGREGNEERIGGRESERVRDMF